MKPHLIGTKKRPYVTKATGADAALSLQEELVAAIHGAFELAVEIAVQEVTKLVGETSGHVSEEVRRENESLKQRLQRAEALLKSARMEQRGGSSPPPPAKQFVDAGNQTDQPHHSKCNQKSPNAKVSNVHRCTGVRGDALSSADSQNVSKDEEERSGLDVKTQFVSGASDPEKNRCAVTRDATTEGV